MTTIPTPHDHGHHEGSYLTPPKGGFFAAVIQWATTVDHKKLGVMYTVAVLSLFMVGGLAALLVRVELWEPTRVVLNEAGEAVTTGQFFQLGKTPAENYTWYNRFFTIHGAPSFCCQTAVNASARARPTDTGESRISRRRVSIGAGSWLEGNSKRMVYLCHRLKSVADMAEVC